MALVFLVTAFVPGQGMMAPAMAQDRAPEVRPAQTPAPDHPARKILAAAWEKLREGDVKKAVILFELALKSDQADIMNEAQLGLAYSFQKQGHLDKAMARVRPLAESGFQPQKTWPLVMDLLLVTNRLEQALNLVDRLPDDLSTMYRKKIEAARQSPQTPGPGPELDAAWAALNAKQNKKALELFSKLTGEPDPDVQQSARLGRAYALWNLGRVEEARSILEELLKKEDQVSKVLPSLIDLTLTQKDYGAARALVDRLPLNQRETWIAKIAQAEKQSRTDEAGRMLGQAWTLFNAKNFHQAFTLFSSVKNLSPKLSLEAAFGRALAAWKLDRTDLARTGLTDLASVDFQPEKTLPALIAILLQQGDLETSRMYLDRAMGRPKSSSAFQTRIRDLETQWYSKKLETLASGSPEHLEIARELYIRNPDDPETRRTLAWSCHGAKDFPCALEHFSTLHQTRPQDPDALLGLGYALKELGRTEKALAFLEKYSGPDTPKLKELAVVLYQSQGQAFLDQKEWTRAEQAARKGLAIDPERQDLLELLGWALFQQDKTEDAQKIFERLFQKQKSSKSAEGVMAALDKSRNASGLWDFLSELATEDRPELRRLAADRYFKEGWPLLAAQTCNGPDTCQFNRDSAFLDLGAAVVRKSGDEGISQLTRYQVPAALEIPLPHGRRLSFNLGTEQLDTGSTSEVVYSGQYYRYLDDPNRQVDDFDGSALTHRPSIALDREGPWSYTLKAGTTPIGGPVSPLPELLFRLKRHRNFMLEFHQRAIENSFLSLVGQKDPYSGQTWGRMVKTGLIAEKTLALASPYWVTLSAGADYIWGKNTRDNAFYQGSASVGRTDPINDWQLSSGIFGLIEHYERNEDFYTFGHGGYFSPSLFLLAGPFVRLNSPICRDFWLDLQASVGYMHYTTESAPHYTHIDEDPALLGAAALADYQGRYDGDTKSGIGVNVKLSGWKQVAPHVALGGRMTTDTSSNHSIWSGSVFLRFSMKPPKTVGQDLGFDASP